MKRLVLIFSMFLAACGTQGNKEANKAPETFKVMSYNVRNAKGMDNTVDCNRIAQIILAQSPNIVAVQELDSMTNRYGKKYILGEIAAITGMHHRYFPAIEFDGGKYGIGILSKEEPLGVKGYPLPGREEQRAILVAEFYDYIFACTHLSLTEEDRLASLEIIGKIAAECKKPFILAGDLNAVPGEPFMSRMGEKFRILSNVESMTFPSPLPDRTLDYIALWKSTDPQWKVVSEQVVEEPLASDHRPVVVVIEK